MTKSLKVIKPLLSLSIGDTLELSKDGKFYVFEYKDHYDESNYMFSTTCSFSIEYANELIKEGYLTNYTFAENKPFINVFDVITNLLKTYQGQLDEVLQKDGDYPMCLKVEKQTVLSNMIKLLMHLNSFKK